MSTGHLLAIYGQPLRAFRWNRDQTPSRRKPARISRLPSLSRRAAWLVAAVLLAAPVAPACGQPAPASPGSPAEDLLRPNPSLTPGAVATSDPAVFCRPGYSRSVRHTSGRVKRDVYRAYGIDRRSGSYEIDHLVPLGIGGADLPSNLWPQRFDTEPWNAALKDRLEWRLVRLVCSGQVAAAEAQADIAADWIAAYGKYCPTEADCPAYGAAHGGAE